MSSTGIPARLKRARKMAKVSRRELSLLAELAQAVVGIIERNPGATPSAETMMKLAGVLGVSLDWLIAGRDPVPTRSEVRTAVEVAREARASREAAAKVSHGAAGYDDRPLPSNCTPPAHGLPHVARTEDPSPTAKPRRTSPRAAPKPRCSAA
jgi:transcriptional regulator with XRE-family HTH domain